jgi:tight adherence protein B
MSATVIIAVAIALTALLVFASVSGVMVYQFRYSPQAQLRRRVKAIVNPGGNVVSGKEKAAGSQRRAVHARLKELEAAGKKAKRFEMRQKILQAGFDIPVSQFYIISVGVGIAAGVIFAILQPEIFYIAPLVAIPVGLFLPTYVLGYIATRRQTKFTSQFADAIDVIVRGIQSGLPIGECMKMIGRESPEPTGNEFRQFTESQRLGLTLDEALKRAIERMPTPEIKFFAIVLNINAQTGGNLAETLGNLSNVLRGRKEMADTIRIKSSEAKSTAMIIGSLPFCIMAMLSVMSPEYIFLLFTEELGHYFLYGGGALMLMGSLVMKSMINLKM